MPVRVTSSSRNIRSKLPPKAVGRRKMPVRPSVAKTPSNPTAQKARRKFLHAFPDGFRDETYLDWERDYKWKAHLRWQKAQAKLAFGDCWRDGHLLRSPHWRSALSPPTNLLFSFEKMALRASVRDGLV